MKAKLSTVFTLIAVLSLTLSGAVAALRDSVGAQRQRKLGLPASLVAGWRDDPLHPIQRKAGARLADVHPL